MVKSMILVGFKNSIGDACMEQIHHFFRSSVAMRRISACSAFVIENQLEDADLVLLPMDPGVHLLEVIRRSGRRCVTARMTLSKGTLDRIGSLTSAGRILVLDHSENSAMEMITLMCQMGLGSLPLSPLYPSSKELLRKSDTVLVLDEAGLGGQMAQQLEDAGEVIDLTGGLLLDIGTIMDISDKLGLDQMIRGQSLMDGYKEVVTSNFSLAWLIAQANQAERQLDLLMQVVDDGILAITHDGLISSVNNRALKILGRSAKSIKGLSGIRLFPDIPFAEVMTSRESIKETLVALEGQDVVLSVDPIVHSGKLYGAVATLKPYDETEIRQHKLRRQLIGKGHKARYRFEDIVGSSEVIMACKAMAQRMATSESSVLLSGESGTGKELFAQAIHNASARKSFQFVAVNCGAMPESLLESELFGYEEGAFTGAKKGGKPGLFELAHRGTLFLDEIGEMPLKLQMRLLRVLQEREVMRIGGDRLIPVDIRLVAATNKNLREKVRHGSFREDLYYRINVLPINLPPLKARREDITELVRHLMVKHGARYQLSPAAAELMRAYDWRGNIRELSNCVEYLSSIGKIEVTEKDLPDEILEELSARQTHPPILRPLNFEERSITESAQNPDPERTQLPPWVRAGGPETLVLYLLSETQMGVRMGRRSISQRTLRLGCYLGEQEIRTHLAKLQKDGLVTVGIGRKGSCLTEQGMRTLKQMAGEVDLR